MARVTGGKRAGGSRLEDTDSGTGSEVYVVRGDGTDQFEGIIFVD